MNNDWEEITDIDQVEKYIGKYVFCHVSWNDYSYGKIRFIYGRKSHFSDGGIGFSASEEVNKDGVHGDWGITTKDLEKGTMKIRVATPEEISKIKISYDADKHYFERRK